MRQLIVLSIILNVFSSLLSAQQPKLVLPIGHSNFINQSLFDSRGEIVVTASADYTAKVWDARSGLLLSTLDRHNGSVEQAVLSANSQVILTGSSDKTARIWSPNGKCLHVLKHEEKSTSIAISPDGHLAATGTTAGKVYIWRTSDGQKVHEIVIESEEYNKKITRLQFNATGDKLLIVTGWTKTVWNALTGGFLHQSGLYALPGNFDSSKLIHLSTDADGISVWNAEDNTSFANFPLNDQSFHHGVVSADRKVVAATFADSTITIFHVLDPAIRINLPGQKKLVSHLALSSGGDFLASVTNDSTIIVWDTSTGDTIKTLRPHGRIFSIAFSEDDKLLASAWDQAIIFEPNNWDYPVVLKGHVTKAYGGRLSKDGTKILFGYEDSIARVIDLQTGKTIATIKDHSGPVVHSMFYPDDSMILSGSYDGVIKVSRASSGKEIFTLAPPDKISSVAITQDSKIILTAHNNNYVILWDARTGKQKKKITTGATVRFAAFHPDNQSFISSLPDSTLRSWDISSGKQLMKVYQGAYEISAYTPDGNYIVCAKGRETRVLNKHGDILFDLPDERLIGIWDSTSILTSTETTLNLWEVRSRKLLATKQVTSSFIRAFDNLSGRVIEMDNSLGKIADFDSFQQKMVFASVKDENLWLLPTGEFYSTPAINKLFHYVTADLRVISFEQLDARFNRPDLLLRAMGNQDSLLIRSYQSAYFKRIKKLQVDTLAFANVTAMPEADIKNRETIRSNVGKRELRLTIHAKDPSTNIDRFNVWVNESPLFGLNGISLKGRRLNNFDTVILILLSTGQNIIETSVTNRNGVESYKRPLYVKYNPPSPEKEMVYFIGIGINRFLEPGHDLNWSVKDIRDLAAALEKKYGDNISIDTLFDENVTIEKVAALKRKLQSSGVNDKVIVAYSGHGLLSKGFDYYLSTYQVNFNNPEQNGLPYEILESLLDSIPARKKLMLIDACHSGEVDKEEMDKYVMIEKSLEDSGTKSDRKPVPKDGVLGMKNSFELMQELFVNVGRSTGATVISAAAGTQFAQEKGSLQNGVFTYSILEYMKTHPTATVTELRQYVNKRVSELTQGMQVPTTRSETRAVDWKVW